MHRWFKYKEGFSAQLVQNFIKEFELKPGHHILDPFAGVSTTLLVAQELGLSATGIEVMPIGDIVWKAKSRIHEYDISELFAIRDWVKSKTPQRSTKCFPHIPITRHAFAPEQEAKLMWYHEQFEALHVDARHRELLRFILLTVLEDISFTSKDGQFLRWDSRSEKVKLRNTRRRAVGRPPTKLFKKPRIVDVKTAVIRALDLIIGDVSLNQESSLKKGKQQLIIDSVLDSLPLQDESQFDAVITSPPYCNRYDYTRTYALELAFLGVSNKEVLDLRQKLLSCTVENRPKLMQLEDNYKNVARLSDYEFVKTILDEHQALQETVEALRVRSRLREVNNRGVISMVQGYFTELAFVILELFNVCKKGALVAIVNDNVRYSGEIVPVDLILTDIAARIGFTPQRIDVLPQRKGNSSQQMGKYGREALRKSILIWKK
ncbi:MAG: DNA methyltransferase [Chloroflexi bacterium]|nr:DNA methyltransferase [Chloroflexota bacterium]